MYTDPIADYLTRIRNAVNAKHRIVEIPASNLKKAMTKILFEKGYILNYKFEEGEKKSQNVIKIALKYHPVTKLPAITTIDRVSRPGLRKYADSGLGIAIISTSQGVMTDKEARKLHIGGEVLCYVS